MININIDSITVNVSSEHTSYINIVCPKEITIEDIKQTISELKSLSRAHSVIKIEGINKCTNFLLCEDSLAQYNKEYTDILMSFLDAKVECIECANISKEFLDSMAIHNNKFAKFFHRDKFYSRYVSRYNRLREVLRDIKTQDFERVLQIKYNV